MQTQTPRYQANFQKRQKGQRYEKRLLPTITFSENNQLFEAFTDTPLGTIQVTGSFDGYDGFGNQCKFDAIQVTLIDGTLIPAYRKQSPDNNYNICQDYSYKAIHP